MGGWERLRLRFSAYPASNPNEARVAGEYLSERIRLHSELPPGRYLYVVDEAGDCWLAPFTASIFSTEGTETEVEVKHSSLVPVDDPVRTAGTLVVDSLKQVGVNAASGHYMRNPPLLGEEIAIWQNAMRDMIEASGLQLVESHPENRMIRLQPE